ncbi:hypothetical protein K469DRAFT_754888 [Zopfia rhizophila CBS 207.26]|uniref:Heme haloperoxidase family profile domain-containing protein n=1 Tax=Zopfia rhizophila CBS 207.26 TaxID=1314779 RepID=A0A6A6DEM9_9PEZI|nr:hypothetical protein K469DRAFT_754888 [Zopfia rhizophila CBS 207.26]
MKLLSLSISLLTPAVGPVSSFPSFPSHLSEAMIQIRAANEARARVEGAALGYPFAKREEQWRKVQNAHSPNDNWTNTSSFPKWEQPVWAMPGPGLNVMANHGSLPHNGVGTMQDFVIEFQEAFCMEIDVAIFLAIYEAIFDDDLLKYSTGGLYPSLLNLGEPLGEFQGLSESHNKYEGDVSPTRSNLSQYENHYVLQLSKFTTLYEMEQENGDSVDLAVLTKYRNECFQESVHNNPYSFNAPFSGVIASPVA